MKTFVLYGSSINNPDLLYASGFKCMDEFLYIQKGRSKTIITSSMETGRAEKESKATRVHSFKELNKRGNEFEDILLTYLEKNNEQTICVPYDFPAGLVDKLRQESVKVEIKDSGFQRDKKNPEEIEYISQTQEATAKAMHKAMTLIADARVHKSILYIGKEELTSDIVKSEINIELIRNGALSGEEPIVVCGDACVNVHDTGHGALRAGETIIIDIFPQSITSRYFSDMTRTFVKGKATKEAKALYEAVNTMKTYMIERVRPRRAMAKLTKKCRKEFEKRGYKTGVVDGVAQGFIHSIGHGLGLEIHEEPMGRSRIKTNAVIAIEPGLYYKGIGGVRLEDVVIAEKGGCRNITKFPEVFEL